MPICISLNGVLCDANSARVSVLDRGFLYGDSVYEVLRTYAGRPFAVAEHLRRLERSAQLLDLALPCPIHLIEQEVHQTLATAGNAESYVRIIVTRGAGPIGLDPALACDPQRVIIVTELKLIDSALYESGVKVCLIPAGRSAGSALPLGAKSGNYLTNLLALRLARQHQAHEAIMLDANGRVAEGSTSNVFAVFGKELVTPPLHVGLLEGITRAKVIQIAQQLGIAVEERELRGEGLRTADELFITSTLREVLPVTQVDDWQVGSGKPGPTTSRLRQAFITAARTEGETAC